jgi:hypothetical protein
MMRAQSFAGTESDQLEELGAVPKKQEQAGAVLIQYEVECICIGCSFPI